MVSYNRFENMGMLAFKMEVLDHLIWKKSKPEPPSKKISEINYTSSSISDKIDSTLHNADSKSGAKVNKKM